METEEAAKGCPASVLMVSWSSVSRQDLGYPQHELVTHTPDSWWLPSSWTAEDTSSRKAHHSFSLSLALIQWEYFYHKDKITFAQTWKFRGTKTLTWGCFPREKSFPQTTSTVCFKFKSTSTLLSLEGTLSGFREETLSEQKVNEDSQHY